MHEDLTRETEIQNQLQEQLPSYRFQHTLGVSYTAACLAMRYGEDIGKARLAGLLHDCAKFMTETQILEECGKAGLLSSDEDLRIPALLHAKLGAYFAQTRYGVADESILEAIRLHSTGKPEMSLLEKIIFAADYMEPGRIGLSGLQQARQYAFTNLDLCICQIAYSTLLYLKQKNTAIDSMTNQTFLYYNELTGGHYGNFQNDGKACL